MQSFKRIAVISLIFIASLFIISLKSYASGNDKAMIYIDTPAENTVQTVKQKLKLEGWVMSNNENINLKVYIDNKEQNTENIIRKERIDVIKAITGYGTAKQNPKPGFEMTIDCSNISDGNHTLAIKVFTSDGKLLTTTERKIKVQKYVAKTYIDTPVNASIIKNELNIEGWVMTDDEKATIKVYLNGKEQEIKNTTRKERTDVIKAITGYGTAKQNPKPGYVLKLDTSNVTDGTYKLEVKIISQKGDVIGTDSRTIRIQKYTANSYVDVPTDGAKVKPTFNISGWVMTDDEESKIKVYIDGKEQTIKSIDRKERNDVIKAIPGYGGSVKNPKPGYTIKLENTNFNNGKHILRVDVVSRENKTISTFSTIINYENYKAQMYIDNPAEDKVVKIDNNSTISGWVMTEDINSTIKAYINGKEQTISGIERKERKDVINAIHGCGNASQNPKPGFNIKLNIGDFNDGVYTLKLAVFSSNGKVIATDERKVEINKYKATGCIDIPIPLGQARKTLYVSGWVMTNDKDSKIKMYIDEKEQKINNLKRVEREDVIKAIPGYGGKESNPTPGYKAEIDVSKFSDGIHTLKVESVSSEGTVMYSENQRIVIYNNYGFGIDVSKHNGNIDWAKVKESGVNFAIVRVGNRGYGAEGNLVTDPKFVDNMKGAISNGIDVGVYFYSQAITESEAIEEADMTLKLIKENGFEGKIKYPIIIDTEKSGGRADSLSKESRTAVVKAFCERVKKAGYEPMIYANKDWLINNLNMNQLESYDVWVAHYNNTTDPIKNPTDYKGKYQIWQYTSTEKINGISGDVDLNIGYKKYL